MVYKMQDKNGLLNLIESVKNNSKLYTNVSQSDEDDFEDWTAVAQECGISITEAQDQWNILLSQYMEYLKNNQDFSLAQHMDFLQPHFFAINDKENIDELELINAIGSKSLGVAIVDNEKQNNKLETKFEDCVEIQKQIEIGEIQPTKIEHPSVSENTDSKTDGISNQIPQDISIANMSSLELIFLGYAKQLQKMPSVLQISTKRKIADIMDEAELQMLSL